MYMLCVKERTMVSRSGTKSGRSEKKISNLYLNGYQWEIMNNIKMCVLEPYSIVNE